MYCQAEMKKSAVPLHIDRKGVHAFPDPQDLRRGAQG